MKPELHLMRPEQVYACRACGRRSALAVYASQLQIERDTPYRYCAHCVDEALERFEVGATRRDRSLFG
jgi:hypothetical protein